ncbi:MAG: TonB-dependent receptor [Prevotella sp.]|jgi:hypothetical protein|nr:TonB-dependent receptor [Prevotella sp.]
MKVTLSLFLFTIICISAQAIDIKGRIIDINTKKPVEFVTAVLLKADSSYVSGCQTDTTGIFLIAGQFPKQDYMIKASFIGYKTAFIKISNLISNIDLGDIELQEESKALGEVTVTGNRIINRVDRQIIMPDSMQIKTSVNAFDLMSNMSIPRLNIDPVNRTIKIGNEEVQLRINGVRASVQEVVALRPQDILRVEFFEEPGVRFGNENVGAVLNLIVDRQKNYGGYVSADGRNSPYIGFGDDNLAFKTNYKASEFGLNYYISYRSYDKRWSDQTETLNFTDNQITRDQKGVYAPMNYEYQYLNFSYNLTKPDKYVFNVLFKNQFYNYKNANSYNIMYSNDIGQTFATGRNKGNDYTPVLDIYYRHELKNKQSLAVNLVGTYINSDSERKYKETEGTEALSDIFNKINGNKYSVIGEAVYEKQFESLSFVSGVKHTQGVADNTYEGDTDTQTKMKNAESYLFAQIQGKIAKKLGYTLGIGGSRIWYKEGDESATYHTFRPSVQLSYSMNDNLSLKYSFIVDTRTPSLGQLSDVEQQTDTYQITRGNPGLKPYNSYRNRLTLNYSKGIFDLNTSLNYIRYHKPIISTFSIEDDKIISFSDNQKSQEYLSWSTNLTVRLIKDIWTLSGWVQPQRSIFKSYKGKIHTYNMIYGGVRSNLQYKNYHLVAGMNTRYKELWGETIWYGEEWSYIETGYKYKEAKLSLGMSLPFGDYWSAGSKNISDIKPSKSWSYIKENGHMFYLRFSWNMSFGRKHEAGKKSLDNADSDKGIL